MLFSTLVFTTFCMQGLAIDMLFRLSVASSFRFLHSHVFVCFVVCPHVRVHLRKVVWTPTKSIEACSVDLEMGFVSEAEHRNAKQFNKWLTESVAFCAQRPKCSGTSFDSGEQHVSENLRRALALDLLAFGYKQQKKKNRTTKNGASVYTQT